MSRLIVVSNRVSQPKGRAGEAAQGGLAMALAAALRKSGGLWVGWSGKAVDQFTGEIAMAEADGVTVATIDLEQQDIDEYYNGYANQTLWPVLHHRIDLAEFDRSFGAGYERVNRRFCTTVTALARPDDMIWVHDYHMLPLAQCLRHQGLQNRVGLFLHTPWAPHRLMTSLPYHRRLVESMLSYDLIGFQAREWHENFLDYVRSELKLVVAADGSFEADGRQIATGVFPIGIDLDEIDGLLQRPDAIEAEQTLRRVAYQRKTIIGVDRLDYSKGIPERFHGYQHYLETVPDAVRRSFLLQVAPLSRDDVASYINIRQELDELSGHINGAFSHVDWMPIHYVNRSYPRDGLMGLYRASDVALVTPLRDGMNLVAKEYVAAQREDDPGVLILSRFAGAAAQLTDALLVNPHSREEIAEALNRALTMPLAERRVRWRRLRDTLAAYDVHRWQREYLAKLAGHATVQTIEVPEPLVG